MILLQRHGITLHVKTFEELRDEGYETPMQFTSLYAVGSGFFILDKLTFNTMQMFLWDEVRYNHERGVLFALQEFNTVIREMLGV